MPFYEYVCEKNSHHFERFFKTFGAAEEHSETTICDCGSTAQRIASVILGVALYGNPDGFEHPSPTKRWSTSHVNQVGGNR
jgi:predicted nucleic acid-binding Zn ribbon protein